MDKAPLYLTVGVDCGNGLPPPVLPRCNFWHDLLTDMDKTTKIMKRSC